MFSLKRENHFFDTFFSKNVISEQKVLLGDTRSVFSFDSLSLFYCAYMRLRIKGFDALFPAKLEEKKLKNGLKEFFDQDDALPFFRDADFF